MAWLKALSFILLIGLVSCQTSIRRIDICLVNGSSAACAQKDDKYALLFPDEMDGWNCFSQESMLLLGSRLEECEINGKLPSDRDTLVEMGICVVNLGCGDVEDHFCTNSKGLRILKDKLEACGERIN